MPMIIEHKTNKKIYKFYELSISFSTDQVLPKNRKPTRFCTTEICTKCLSKSEQLYFQLNIFCGKIFNPKLRTSLTYIANQLNNQVLNKSDQLD